MPDKFPRGFHKKSIAESIVYSIFERPQETVLEKYKERVAKKVHFNEKLEKLWKKRGVTPIEANMDLFAQDELS